MIQMIVSGGQTGVDRAALDVALQLAIPCGGWCPKGRKAEDGRIPLRYPLKETPSDEYPQRTEWNVRDSDATLILTRDRPTEGTAFTLEVAARLRKPCFVVDLTGPCDPAAVRAWAQQHHVKVLNVAGPRESRHPGGYQKAVDFLRRVLAPAP
jgi:hypothetical protein